MTANGGAHLSARQTMISIVVGVVLWFAAALLLRAIGPMGAYEGGTRALVYAATIPGTVPFVYLLRSVAGLGIGQTAPGMALAVMAATLCDGVALAWFPSLYGTGVDLHAGAGAAILWGAGVALALGFALERRA